MDSGSLGENLTVGGTRTYSTKVALPPARGQARQERQAKRPTLERVVGVGGGWRKAF